jgi:hypothetical protein
MHPRSTNQLFQNVRPDQRTIFNRNNVISEYRDVLLPGKVRWDNPGCSANHTLVPVQNRERKCEQATESHHTTDATRQWRAD